MRILILWTAFVMLLWNPLLLWVDVGFQLSFLAVIGLTEMTPILQPILRRLPLPSGVRDALLTTIAAQIVAMPWVAVRFGRLPLLSPIANILTVPILVPLSMLFGFLGTVTSILWFPLGQCISALGWLTMESIILVAQLFARIPYTSLTIDHPSITIIILYYAALVALLFFVHRYRNRFVSPPKPRTFWTRIGRMPGSANVRQTMSVPGRSSR